MIAEGKLQQQQKGEKATLIWDDCHSSSIHRKKTLINRISASERDGNCTASTPTVCIPKELGQIKTVTRWTFVSFINLLNTLSQSVVVDVRANKWGKNGIAVFLFFIFLLNLSHRRAFALLSLPLGSVVSNQNKTKEREKSAQIPSTFFFFDSPVKQKQQQSHTKYYRIAHQVVTPPPLPFASHQQTASPKLASLLYYRIINDSWY